MDGIAKADSALFTINNVWMLVSTILVFIMHLGFASLEVGLTRAKNTVNILFKNVSILAIGILTYSICGFNLMYPGNFAFGEYFGFGGWGISTPEGSAGLIDYFNGQYTYFTDFIFQAMFAATAATIVSGAVAERIKLSSFLIFSTIYVAFVYPIAGSWKWGEDALSVQAQEGATDIVLGTTILSNLALGSSTVHMDRIHELEVGEGTSEGGVIRSRYKAVNKDITVIE